MTAILVTGDRDWRDRQWIETVLTGYKARSKQLTVIEGCARGADMIAHTWGEKQQRFSGYEHLHFPADWDRYGKKAGPIRNRQMLKALMKLPAPRFVLAFHDDLEVSKGTRHMVLISQVEGITVRLHSHMYPVGEDL